MKQIIYGLMSTGLLTLLSGCFTTTRIGNIAEISYKTKNDKSIEKGLVGIEIQLFDFRTKEKVSINDVQELPGKVRDSTMNSKLLIFNKESTPKRIEIKKPGKGLMFVSPKFDNNNLVIYKFYLSTAEKTNI